MQRLQQMLHRMLRGSSRSSLENEAWRRIMIRETNEHHRQLNTPLTKLEVAGIDSETTGFTPEHGDELISLAAVKWNGKYTAEPFHSLIHTQSDIPGTVSELTGITKEHLSNAPGLEEVIPPFFTYVDSSVLIGYFVGHDIKFLNYFLWKKYRSRITHRVLDLYGIMPVIEPHLVKATFDDACRYFGVTNPARHTALGDALAVIELWRKVIAELQHQEIITLEHLYQKLAKYRDSSNL